MLIEWCNIKNHLQAYFFGRVPEFFVTWTAMSGFNVLILFLKILYGSEMLLGV